MASIGMMAHVLHANRFPSFYAAFFQTKKLRFNIPSWVFWPVWFTIVVCDAVFAVLFFKGNSDYNDIYQAMAWVYFANWALMLTWNWLYFNMINYYAVGAVGVLIFLTQGALFALTLAYKGQHWFTIVIIAVPLAWTAFAAVGSVLFAYWEAAELENVKKKVGKMTTQLVRDYDPDRKSEEAPVTPSGYPTLPPSMEPSQTTNGKNKKTVFS